MQQSNRPISKEGLCSWPTSNLGKLTSTTCRRRATATPPGILFITVRGDYQTSRQVQHTVVVSPVFGAGAHLHKTPGSRPGESNFRKSEVRLSERKLKFNFSKIDVGQLPAARSRHAPTARTALQCWRLIGATRRAVCVYREWDVSCKWASSMLEKLKFSRLRNF